MDFTDKYLKFIKDLSWVDVFDFWRKGEENIPRWIEHYKSSGYNSWDEWREHTLSNLPYKDLCWKLFEVDNPIQTVPNFFGGPFRAWKARYYGGNNTVTFADLAKNEELQNSQIIREMISNFPDKTYLIGLEANKEIVIIEGMHRCCALAIAEQDKKPIQTKVFIALAEFNGELPEMGQANSPTE
jgi:hypothetical protein